MVLMEQRLLEQLVELVVQPVLVVQVVLLMGVGLLVGIILEEPFVIHTLQEL
jgi:hypothetical protein